MKKSDFLLCKLALRSELIHVRLTPRRFDAEKEVVPTVDSDDRLCVCARKIQFSLGEKVPFGTISCAKKKVMNGKRLENVFLSLVLHNRLFTGNSLLQLRETKKKFCTIFRNLICIAEFVRGENSPCEIKIQAGEKR